MPIPIPTWPKWIQSVGDPNHGQWRTIRDDRMFHLVMHRPTDTYRILLRHTAAINPDPDGILRWTVVMECADLTQDQAHALRQGIMRRLDAYLVAGVL